MGDYVYGFWVAFPDSDGKPSLRYDGRRPKVGRVHRALVTEEFLIEFDEELIGKPIELLEFQPYVGVIGMHASGSVHNIVVMIGSVPDSSRLYLVKLSGHVVLGGINTFAALNREYIASVAYKKANDHFGDPCKRIIENGPIFQAEKKLRDIFAKRFPDKKIGVIYDDDQHFE